jgi:hypothetical protein
MRNRFRKREMTTTTAEAVTLIQKSFFLPLRDGLLFGLIRGFCVRHQLTVFGLAASVTTGTLIVCATAFEKEKRQQQSPQLLVISTSHFHY